MNWFVAMICLIPLLAWGSGIRVLDVRIPYGQKARTWLAMTAGSLAAWMVHFDNPALFYAGLDMVAAYIILRKPLGEMQRAVGLLFIGMFAVDIGFAGACWLQPGPHNLAGYVTFNSLIGWLQWACLALWGVGDVMAGYFATFGRIGGYPLPARDGF